MPKVSVLMPAYNAEKYIAEAMESILNQTFQDFEFIVLNDCSRDGTEEIILSYDDPRIVYVKNPENMGVAGTLNRGLELAQGEYIARMDADDISLPQRFEAQVRHLDAHPEVAVLATNVELFDENGAIGTGWSSSDPAQMKVDLLFSCGLAHPSVMMRKAVIRELGGYDLAFEGMEDYQLWCRVAKNHAVTMLPQILFRYRIHSAQVTKNPSPEYLNRLQALRHWQLEQLGICPDEEKHGSWYRYCQGKGLPTVEDILSAAAFFETALQANAKYKEYDEICLRRTFRGILLAATGKLDKPAARTVCSSTAMISMGELKWHSFKQWLKKLLRRLK